jgi:hypothetical protein
MTKLPIISGRECVAILEKSIYNQEEFVELLLATP